MANGMYSTPLMGTGIVANPMQLQRNAMLMGTTMPTMPTTPQVSTPMPPMSTTTQTPQVSTPMPTVTQISQAPQVSTVMPNPMGNGGVNAQSSLSYTAIFSADPNTIFTRRAQDVILFGVPSTGYPSNFAENQQRFKANFETFYSVSTPNGLQSSVEMSSVKQNGYVPQFPPILNEPFLDDNIIRQNNLLQNTDFQNQIKQNIGSSEVSVPLANNFAVVSPLTQKTSMQIAQISLPVNAFYDSGAASKGIRQNSAIIVSSNRYPVNVFYTNSR